ncbi:MAG: hypothetical protein EKK55_16870 [Rhodocyclaceae bacterium]|nr:MAG: hypothetical protein EKK55_16870 [Rhodocyclaceae bacterium]
MGEAVSRTEGPFIRFDGIDWYDGLSELRGDAGHGKPRKAHGIALAAIKCLADAVTVMTSFRDEHYDKGCRCEDDEIEGHPVVRDDRCLICVACDDLLMKIKGNP